MSRKDKLLKNDNIDKEKQVSNIRPDYGVSPETSSPKSNIEIIGDSMINGVTPVGLSSKYKHRFRKKPYGGAISEDLLSITSAQFSEESQTLLQYTLGQFTLQTTIVPAFRLI